MHVISEIGSQHKKRNPHACTKQNGRADDMQCFNDQIPVHTFNIIYDLPIPYQIKRKFRNIFLIAIKNTSKPALYMIINKLEFLGDSSWSIFLSKDPKQFALHPFDN